MQKQILIGALLTITALALIGSFAFTAVLANHGSDVSSVAKGHGLIVSSVAKAGGNVSAVATGHGDIVSAIVKNNTK